MYTRLKTISTKTQRALTYTYSFWKSYNSDSEYYNILFDFIHEFDYLRII